MNHNYFIIFALLIIVSCHSKSEAIPEPNKSDKQEDSSSNSELNSNEVEIIQPSLDSLTKSELEDVSIDIDNSELKSKSCLDIFSDYKTSINKIIAGELKPDVIFKYADDYIFNECKKTEEFAEVYDQLQEELMDYLDETE